MSSERMPFIVIGDECAPGDFMDNVRHDVKRAATTIDAVAKPAAQLSDEAARAAAEPAPAFGTEMAEVIGSMAAALQYVRQYGRLTFAEHEMVRAAVTKFERWAGGQTPKGAA